MFRAANHSVAVESHRPVGSPRYAGWRPGWVSRGVALLTLALAIAPPATYACPNHDVTKTKTVTNTTGGAVGGVRFRTYLDPVPICHAVSTIKPGSWTSSIVANSATQYDFVYLGTLANNASVTLGYEYYNGGGDMYIGSWWFTDNTGGVQIGPTHHQIIFFHGNKLNVLNLKSAGPASLVARDIKFKALPGPLDPADVNPDPVFVASLTPLADSLIVPTGAPLVVNLPVQPPNGGSSIAYFRVAEAGQPDQAIDMIQTNFTVAMPGLSPGHLIAASALVLGASLYAVLRRRDLASA